MHDAQDLTQSFFAYFIEHELYGRADQQKSKFRSFLLASLKNFLADATDRERTLKRVGQSFLPLDEKRTSRPNHCSRRTIPRAAKIRSSTGVGRKPWSPPSWSGFRRVYRDETRNKLFKELRIFVAGGAEPIPTYAELATRLGLSPSTLRSHVTQLRARIGKVTRGVAPDGGHGSGGGGRAARVASGAHTRLKETLPWLCRRYPRLPSARHAASC